MAAAIVNRAFATFDKVKEGKISRAATSNKLEKVAEEVLAHETITPRPISENAYEIVCGISRLIKFPTISASYHTSLLHLLRGMADRIENEILEEMAKRND
jgi:hypothetical protein